MTRDRLHESPATARIVLALGAAIHFLLCWPLFGRRGFPEANPFWLAMEWLWIPPILVSAIFIPPSKRRAVDLACYGLIVGFTISWGTVYMVPSRKGPVGALFDMSFEFPWLLVAIIVVEFLGQSAARALRVFVPRNRNCRKCGYCLFGLESTRCPECGTPFDPAMLDPEYHPDPTPWHRRWVTYLIVFTCLCSIGFPFEYRQWIFHRSEAGGQSRAESDWSSGQAIWFVRPAEISAMTAQEAQRFFNSQHRRDGQSGLEIQMMWTDWQHEKWQSSYRSVIERKLKESGRSLPRF